MKTIFQIAVMFILTGTLLGSDQQLPDRETPENRFAVSGLVLDDSGIPVANSVVIPLSAHGIPLNVSDARPVTMQLVQESGLTNFVLFAKTDNKGKFTLQLPSGGYRIVAQSCLDKPDVEDLLGKNGSRLRVDGVAEFEFSGEMQATAKVIIRPIGSGTVTLSTQESSDLLLVSTKPLACDPAIGMLALVGDFWTGLVAGTRMEEKSITISGLPAGEIQFFSFVNDNNGGIGGSKTLLEEGESTELYLGVIAGWSNGHRTPPDELKELVQYLQEHPEEEARIKRHLQEVQRELAESANDAEPLDLWESHLRLAKHLPEPWILADGKQITVADAWAAMRYCELAKK